MLDPTYLATCTNDVVDLFADVENQIMEDIVRRIDKTGYVTATAKWQLEKAQQIGLLQGDVQGYLSKALRKSSKEINRLFKEAAVQCIKVDDHIYNLAGLQPISINASDNMKAIILQGTQDTRLLMKNFTKTTAASADGALINSLDKAYLLVQSGTYDYNSAVRLVVNELAQGGIKSVTFSSGTTDRIDVAVRRAVRTALNQTCAKLQLYRASEMGCDLVEVTAHLGARPSHEKFQGKVYSVSGKNKKYQSFLSATGYGSGDGLCGWNCRHSFFPFFEGISERVNLPVDKKENAEQYILSQKQRRYERIIRDAKRECVTLNAAYENASNEELAKMFKEDFTMASVKLKKRETKFRLFLEDNNLIKRSGAEWTSGFNRSVSAKAVWANRKSKS